MSCSTNLRSDCARHTRRRWKIAGLVPLGERHKAFRLLIAVLTIADARHRERYCPGGCGHWWHTMSGAGRSLTPDSQQ
ncbi:DUF5958 family protein [Streptomyces sp. NRRL WC-3549]|uniref:DUF5958 family protein n=1 Tax=Streptomyces sp. NRRL WC-3549 TaxID=1463925 RepID=UPI001F306340|nr:DUF5958 family protein [Streptomyces sp. NRRL WC-3549]